MTEDTISGILDFSKRPLIISGPCSAETEKQVMDTAKGLKDLDKVDLFRAGIWKPRTYPGSFEGVGEVGFPWLKRVKEEYGFPLTVEVAKAKHVELCLENDIDVLWIGARSTTNPFVVQEIADAISGVDIPVMVKNPINPDIALWLGAIERLLKSGASRVAAIHRGFSNLGEKYYRNSPQWQIAIEFRRQFPDIPLICDPSHICGRRETIFEVSQKAIDLRYDGLMIESHIDPDHAWSDASQQLTPPAFGALMDRLTYRTEHMDDPPIQNELEMLRNNIDNIDETIIRLLANRMEISRKIGHYKKENSVTIFQSKRWNEIINRCVKLAIQEDLSEEFIINYIKAVHDESIDQQENIMNED
ncbi:MAG: bifunctional 3-deoxy-7-phosphoheptulonate synthase/chorismate mutase type II [Bacteroidia bacterium]|nr:bifunctional 3-deoxy-7-phosphoheptulonate synthase/chorismate mutase type II [Bacteroidia bacterium]